MSTIFDTHHPWILMFGLLGNIISLIVYFSPLPTFIQIYKRKSTLGFQSLPYVLALFSATLWMFYALLKTDAFLLISINSVGCFIETIYILVFLFYASPDTRKQTAKLVGLFNVVVFCAICLFTMLTEHGSHRVEVVGWICVVISVCVFAAPLSIVLQVVRTKSVEFMPFGLSFTLTISAVMWFGYGLLKKDLYVAVPNVLGFLLGISQMVLYGIYRSPSGSKGVKEVLVVELPDEKKMTELQNEKKMNDQHIINIINVVPGSTCSDQVYPASSSDDEAIPVNLDSTTTVNILVDCTTTTTTNVACSVPESDEHCQPHGEQLNGKLDKLDKHDTSVLIACTA